MIPASIILRDLRFCSDDLIFVAAICGSRSPRLAFALENDLAPVPIGTGQVAHSTPREASNCQNFCDRFV